ncbi:MAG: tetratricopeptide repeat protein [Bacteroidetes bacterium]|nr:tetratricopeptide repeat protein [Bacteroidota bacterium]
MRFLIIIFSFILLSKSSSAYYEFDANLKSAYSSIISFDFEKSKTLLLKEKTEKPGNDLVILYSNYIDFLKAFISEEEKYFDEFKKKSNENLKLLDKREENITSPFHHYAKAEILIQQALVKVKFREYVSAATDIRKAYRLIEKNKLAYPEFLLNNKLSGFLTAVIGAVPREYHWLVEIAGMEGSVPDGTTELKTLFKTLEKSEFSCYREELLFYLSELYITFNSNEADLLECMIYMRPYAAGSALMRYSTSAILMKMGRNDEAYDYLKDPAAYNTGFPFDFMYYKLALCKLRKLDFSASKDFEEFIKRFKGQNFIKSSYQKLAWIESLQNNPQGYYTYMTKCRSLGTAFIDEDKDAQSEAAAIDIGNKLLLRARLLFDGGYYDKAQLELAGMPVDSFPKYKDQLEVTYRLARIYQKTGQEEKAIDLYQKTIDNGASATFYFAANSALLLGMIYEDKNDLDKSESFYKKCLSMERHQYQNSIDQKAQAGLDRIKILRNPE